MASFLSPKFMHWQNWCILDASSLLCSPLGSTDKRSEVNRLTCSFAQCAEMRASRFGNEPQSSNYPMRKE